MDITPPWPKNGCIVKGKSLERIIRFPESSEYKRLSRYSFWRCPSLAEAGAAQFLYRPRAGLSEVVALIAALCHHDPRCLMPRKPLAFLYARRPGADDENEIRRKRVAQIKTCHRKDTIYSTAPVILVGGSIALPRESFTALVRPRRSLWFSRSIYPQYPSNLCVKKWPILRACFLEIFPRP
jgi:hypothetical protein